MTVSGPEVIKLISCSTQLRQKFILLLNVKMPTIVGILTFIDRINYHFLSFEQELSTIFHNFKIYEQLKFHASLNKFSNLEAGLRILISWKKIT